MHALHPVLFTQLNEERLVWAEHVTRTRKMTKKLNTLGGRKYKDEKGKVKLRQVRM
jgi:hypothetical protein